WPGPEVWQELPAPLVEEICRGLLANDIVSFQTGASARNFLLTCTGLLSGVEADPEGLALSYRGRWTRVRHHPISVDVEELRQYAASPEVGDHKRQLAPLCGHRTIVRVDRLDPSKNVLGGFQAFDLFLQRYPQWVGQVSFLAFLVPSRTAIPEYQAYTQAVFRLAEEINARHGQPAWQPIRVFNEDSYPQGIAALSLYDVLLANPLADGMNLVSKEGPIVNERDGVLVLSRNAGSFEELGGASLPVDPEDIPATAEALAVALAMPPAKRRARAGRLRRIVEERDLTSWLAGQLEDLRDVMASSHPRPARTSGPSRTR
ncbi:MAG TPA: trehalose-6-phosphate synthase, partial [Dehalococcoidia bacterium]|nr:trehalose-6-phosphate synthase [Dehalococcoidia bacterium]